MIPLTENPTVHVLIDEQGNVRAVKTNVSANLRVVVTDNPHDFRDDSLGMMFEVK